MLKTSHNNSSSVFHASSPRTRALNWMTTISPESVLRNPLMAHTKSELMATSPTERGPMFGSLQCSDDALFFFFREGVVKRPGTWQQLNEIKSWLCSSPTVWLCHVDLYYVVFNLLSSSFCKTVRFFFSFSSSSPSQQSSSVAHKSAKRMSVVNRPNEQTNTPCPWENVNVNFG